MHTLLILSSVLLVVLGGHVVLRLLPGVDGWRQRRRLQLLVLASPIISLGVGLAGLSHAGARICLLDTPRWDTALGTAVPVAMGLVALGGAGLGVMRLGLMSWATMRRSVAAGQELQALADRLADRLGAPHLQVRVRASGRPLALISGLRQPTLLLSTWMLHSLDRREIESVLAHELGHLTRCDYPVIWLATVLRDAFFYLPTSRTAYRQLQTERETACDDLAVSVTQRPLALASALAKVWQKAVSGPTRGIAPAFAGEEGWIEQRIERLIEGTGSGRVAPPPRRSRGGSAGLGASTVVGLVVLQAAAIVVLLLHPMACGPAWLAWKVL